MVFKKPDKCEWPRTNIESIMYENGKKKQVFWMSAWKNYFLVFIDIEVNYVRHQWKCLLPIDNPKKRDSINPKVIWFRVFGDCQLGMFT